jgi:hypothetical protein
MNVTPLHNCVYVRLARDTQQNDVAVIKIGRTNNIQKHIRVQNQRYTNLAPYSDTLKCGHNIYYLLFESNRANEFLTSIEHLLQRICLEKKLVLHDISGTGVSSTNWFSNPEIDTMSVFSNMVRLLHSIYRDTKYGPFRGTRCKFYAFRYR